MRGSRGWTALFLSVIVAMGVVDRLVAQIGAGAMAGSLVDQAGAALPGATVTVVAGETNLSRSVVTDQSGDYFVGGLAPGSYRVRAELSGFRPLIREGIRVTTGETVRLDLQLELSGLTEALTVSADAPLLRSETSGLGQVIDNR
jgi:Carboxypeptidase regulatory-like domain